MNNAILRNTSILAATLSLGLISGTADANICHNIGGPQQLGANCDQTSQDEYTCAFDNGTAIVLKKNQFLGIVIFSSPDHLPPNEQALAAHLAHGDGFADTIFATPLHLASEVGPHKLSNVECIGTRFFDQPPEPGN
ncbi:MAG: hypothetical protein PHG00_02715 [Methylococcales bacterium]|nr:hypothetical protein [Methylococcales bacterium]